VAVSFEGGGRMSEVRIRRYVFLVLLLFSSTVLFAQKKSLHVIYIGDSITAGAGLSDPSVEAPPVIASDYLKKQAGIDNVLFSNQGHSGFTTVDFLPGGNAFKLAEVAASGYANRPGIMVFSVMLGTNDSAIKGPNGSPVAPENYGKNLKIIIDQLLKDYPGCKIIINHPVWYSPNTYNGAQYLQEGLDRLQSYFPVIKGLVSSYATTNKGQIFLGDTKAFDFFKKNYLNNFQSENGHQGTFYLHPNATGAKALGDFWGAGIYAVVK